MKKLVIVIPAHNEEKIIEKNTLKVINFLKKQKISVDWHILIAENGSKDKTLDILRKMPKSKNFAFTSIEARSRDQAIKGAWMKTQSDYYMFMDADLATDIKHIPELVKGLNEGYDLVIGSRRMPNSKVKRPLFRKIISQVFHTLMKLTFGLKVNDLQCGFKAVNRKVVQEIMPKIKYSEEGFLDTEMLVLATRKNYKIKEIPVRWSDDRESRFNIKKTIIKILINSYRIKRDLLLGKYDQ